jgi:hypothetical protein
VTQAIYDPFNVGIRFLDVSVRKREQLVQLIAEIKEMRELEQAQAALITSETELASDLESTADGTLPD